MKIEDNQSALLRKYIRESLITEYVNVGRQASKLTAGVAAAVKGLKDDSRAVGGKAKELGAAVKRGAKLTLAQTAEFLTVGLYKANRDKIDNEYITTLKKIKEKYQSSYDQLDSKFKENADPLIKAAILYNPAAAVAGYGLKKAASKLEKSSLKLGASPEIKKEIDEYYASLEDSLKKNKDKDRRAGQTKPEPTRRQVTSRSEMETIKKSLEEQNKTLIHTGTGENTLYGKNKKIIDFINSELNLNKA